MGITPPMTEEQIQQEIKRKEKKIIQLIKEIGRLRMILHLSKIFDKD